MSVCVQSASTSATRACSATPKVRSRSEKRSPSSTASEPTAAPSTMRSSSCASLNTRSRRASRCSTVNTTRDPSHASAGAKGTWLLGLVEPDRRELRSRALDRFDKPGALLRPAGVLAREHELVERLVRPELDPLGPQVFADRELPREEHCPIVERLHRVGQERVRLGDEHLDPSRGTSGSGMEPELQERFLEVHGASLPRC